MKTAEGVHLQQSIERFTILHQKYLNGEKVLDDDHVIINDVNDSRTTNFIDIADEDRRELHVCEMKVKRPSVETTVEICDEDDDDDDDEEFYSGPPLILQPLSPLVNDDDCDPEEMLKLLNNAL